MAIFLLLSAFTSISLSYVLYRLAYTGGSNLSLRLLRALHYKDYIYFQSVSPKTFLNLLVYSNNILVRKAIFPVLSLPYSLITILTSLIASTSFLTPTLLLFVLPFILILPITRILYFYQTQRSSLGFQYENKLTADVSRLTDSTYEFLTFRFLDQILTSFSRNLTSYRQLLVFQSLTPRVIKSSLEILIVISSSIRSIVTCYWYLSVNCYYRFSHCFLRYIQDTSCYQYTDFTSSVYRIFF